jgi:ATP-dependent DNA ligase
VVQVRFSEWTRDLYLRQPAYLGLRPDKSAGAVVAEFPVVG